MKAQQYAEALYEASKNKDDATCETLVANLLQLVKNRGHEALLPAIYRELDTLTQQRLSAQEVVLRVAHETEVKKYHDAIKKDIETLQACNLPVETIVDQTIVGGYEVKVFGKQIDRTYKRSLLSLYTSLITNS